MLPLMLITIVNMQYGNGNVSIAGWSSSMVSIIIYTGFGNVNKIIDRSVNDDSFNSV